MRLCKQMGCTMNDTQCITVFYVVIVCKVREEVDHDLEQFFLS